MMRLDALRVVSFVDGRPLQIGCELQLGAERYLWAAGNGAPKGGAEMSFRDPATWSVPPLSLGTIDVRAVCGQIRTESVSEER